MADDNYFMGLDGFVWFTGVVEDRNDPAKLGRVRVRCLGLHTEDKNEIPTEALPWAHVMHPINDPSMQGMGNTPAFMVEGTWVVGFFRDVQDKQQPIVMGTLPGYSQVPDDIGDDKSVEAIKRYREGDEKGFTDPNKKYPQYPNEKSGHDLNESDVNRLARNDVDFQHNMLTEKEDLHTNFESVETTRGRSWGIPKYAEFAKYPFNHVFESESGHIREYDDTEFEERIHEYHRTGTYYEVDGGGNRVTHVVGDNYELIAGSNYINVKGEVNLTVEGTCNTLIREDWNIKVEGDLNLEVVKDFNTLVQGDTTQLYESKLITTALGPVSSVYNETLDSVIIGAVTDTYGATIDRSITGDVTERFGATLNRYIVGIQTDIHDAEFNINSTAGGVNINSVDEIKLFSTEVDLKASSGITLDASDINLNSGTKGAARLDDTAIGTDTAGLGAGTVNSTINSASATVKIGSADPGIGDIAVEASELIVTDITKVIENGENIAEEESLVDAQGPDRTEEGGTGRYAPNAEGDYPLPILLTRDADLVATAEEELGISDSGLSAGEAQAIIEGRALEKQAPDPSDPTGKTFIEVSDPDENEALETGDGGLSGTPVQTGAAEPNRKYLNLPDKSETFNSEVELTDEVKESRTEKFLENGDPKLIWLSHVDSGVKTNLISILENIADDLGYPLTITSGLRSQSYNQKVGGAKKSQHVLGNAVDIRMRNKTKKEVLEFIEIAVGRGINGIGLYFPARGGGTFIHCDIRSKKAQWGPSGSWKGQYSWAKPTMKKLGYYTGT
jgi:uncharacterized protein YcbK (DUF882 family)